MLRTFFAAASVFALTSCTAYDWADQALYDDPSFARRDPRFDSPYDAGYSGSGGPIVYDRYGRPLYAAPGVHGSLGYYGTYGDASRPKRRVVIEDAQYESVNGQRIDASRYVRKECQGEHKCDFKASNKVFGDPDVGAHKDLIVRYRCGKGPTRTVRVPEKSEGDIRC